MKKYTEEEALDAILGPKGTELRNEYETEMDKFRIGEAIRQARQNKKLTQEKLGEMVGVKKAQICKIEHGGNITIDSITKLFKAMEINAYLELSGFGKVQLC